MTHGASSVLVIDEGTTSTRAVVYDSSFDVVSTSQQELGVTYPASGLVEQDAGEIWQRTLVACRLAIERAGGIEAIAGIGITNQRETTVVWDARTGEPLAPAIVWQDRRTETLCSNLRDAGHEPRVQELTGLLLDPYFSGTKLQWILQNVPAARAAADAGHALFGTIDSFLIWKLTGGALHVTDPSNASRTMLFELEQASAGAGDMSAELIQLLDVPIGMLPRVRPSSGSFGDTAPEHFGRRVPILSAIGDQQSALVGHGCLEPGAAKITFGTGAFLVANTGESRPRSENRLLATAGYVAATDELPFAYALEGSIFNAGTVVQWLRDDMGLLRHADDSAVMARSVSSTEGVYLVPAFTGLGAPHWNADARGTLTGITRATKAAHVVRAGLESAAFQTYDLLTALEGDGAEVKELRVDGGMARNDWLMQRLADITGLDVFRPSNQEMTALGAAVLAGVQLGWTSLAQWRDRERPGTRFSPSGSADVRARDIEGWRRALRVTLMT